jgi:hypothetical protein
MKLDLGLVRIDIPRDAPMIPTMVIALGDPDSQQAVGGVGPTLAKEKTYTYRRSLAVSMTPFDEGETDDKALTRGLNDAVKRTGAQVSALADAKVAGAAAKTAEFNYAGPEGVPLVTLALVVAFRGFLYSFFVTALRDKKTDKSVRAQFKSIVDSFAPGSAFDKPAQ